MQSRGTDTIIYIIDIEIMSEIPSYNSQSNLRAISINIK